MHTRIPKLSELIDELKHPTITAAAILTAADLAVEDLKLEVDPLHLPDVDLADIDQPGLAGTAAPAMPKGTPARTTTPTSLSGTTHTTIRIPAEVLAAYKVKAASLGIGYQTLMILKLQAAMPL